MSLKRAVAILAIVGVLGSGVMAPAAAGADGAETFIIVAAALGAYIGLIVVATAWIYRTPSSDSFAPVPANQVGDDRQPADGVRLGPRCAQQSGGLTLMCW